VFTADADSISKADVSKLVLKVLKIWGGGKGGLVYKTYIGIVLYYFVW
jgi:hypothetical protein